MTDIEGMKEIVNQVAIQAATAIMMAFRDTDIGAGQWQPQTSEKNKGRGMEYQELNWDAEERYVQQLDFELEVTSISDTRVYKISDKEKVPVLKN